MSEDTNTKIEAQGPYNPYGLGERPLPIAGHDQKTYDQVLEEEDWKDTQRAFEVHKIKVAKRKAFIANIGKKLFGSR